MMRTLNILIAVFFGMLFFSVSIHAQPQEDVDPKIMKEVESLYERKDEVKAFIFQLVRRKLAQDMYISLESKGFPEDEIQTVLDGDAFETFSDRVANHPVLKAHVDTFIERTLRPDRLRKTFLRRKAELRTAQTTQFVLMLRRALMDRRLRLTEPEEEDPTLLNRLFAGIQGLFREGVN